MRATVPEDVKESGGNGALNKQETPSWSPVEHGQFTLGSATGKCREGAAYLAVLAKGSRQSNGYSLGTIASLVGKETPYVSKCLDVEDPHSALLMIAAVILLDKDRSFLGGLARAAGCDLVERPTMTDAEFRRRVEAHARHSKPGAAWLEEALEDAP